MSLDKTLEKLMDASLEKLGRVPSYEDIVDGYAEGLISNYPLRRVGDSDTTDLLLSEELRAAHVHILGTTREGKSKLLEQFIRHDIDNGFGATLIDPSANGKTALSVLQYCIKQKFDNVIWIDLNDRRTLPTINPLKWLGVEAASGVVASCMDAVQLLWSQDEWQKTSRIQTYLKALFTVLYFAKCTIPDAEAFSVTSTERGRYADEDIAELERQRQIIFNRVRDIPEARHARSILKEVFAKPQLFSGEFRPTVRRLEAFMDVLPRRIFGSTHEPVDFVKLVRDKSIILVNMDMRGIGGDELRRLIGTVIINGIVNAISYLNKRTANNKDGSPKAGGGWQGRHYLYMDEGGLFATRALSDIMSHYGKTGLWATIAHQYFRQFSDDQIIHGIENSCHIKCMFFTANDYDRNRMLKNMYFGEDMLKQAPSAAANLKKQHMMIRIGKEPAKIIRVADVPDVNIPPIEVWNFQDNIYKANSFYRTPKSVDEEITNRFDKAPNKATRPNASRPQQPIRPDGFSANAPASSPQDGLDNQTAVKPDAPVERGRPSGGQRQKVQRQKGISPSLLPKHPRGDE
jgi:hypothetical protein